VRTDGVIRLRPASKNARRIYCGCCRCSQVRDASARARRLLVALPLDRCGEAGHLSTPMRKLMYARSELESACTRTAGCVASQHRWSAQEILCRTWRQARVTSTSKSRPHKLRRHLLPDFLLAGADQRLVWPWQSDWYARAGFPHALNQSPPRLAAVSPALSYSVTPAAASAAVLAYAKHINDVVFMNSAASPLPAGSLATVNVNIANPNVLCSWALMRFVVACSATSWRPPHCLPCAVLHPDDPCGWLCCDPHRQYDLWRLHGLADALAGRSL